MAYSSLTSLLRRPPSSPILRRTPRCLTPARRTSTSATAAAASPGDSPKSTLSARMSFVFDQIDAVERERNEKDETLRRIRAWREKKHRADADQSAAAAAAAPAPSPAEVAAKKNVLGGKEVELVHPWPEWVEFMELLMRQNYFDHRRRDESRSVPNLVDGGDDDLPVFVEEGIDFTRDVATVRTACVNFGRDRFDILRPLSRKDIQVLVGYGCPSSTDGKLIFSAKVLRKYVHLNEGDVCSACSMRNSCSKAYLLTRKEDEARTVDVIRLLLTYGFDPINGSVENKSLMTNKSIKTVIRKLLYEISKLASVPIDPNLPPPIIKKPPPKIKQPPPPPKKRVGRDDIEMKKGDWLCPKCDFMNFAKNTICLQCDAKRPKRQLLPGEWECPGCNFLNYRRNMVCFHCEHKRPPDEYIENKVQEKQSHPGTRLQRLARNPVMSDAWNFDFDDNESDGADVAAFEFADPPKADGLYSVDNQTHENGKMHEFQGEYMFVNDQAQGVGEERQYSEPRKRWGPPSVANGTGFDDFDDEDDDDDVDSYEIDSPDNQSKHESTWSSGSNDFHDDGDSPQLPQRQMPLSDSRYCDSDLDSEVEHSDHSNWKSSHIANDRQKSKSENTRHMGLSFGSDDELGFSSDGDDRRKSSLQDFSQKRDNRRKQSPVRNPRNKHSETEDEVLFGSDSEGEDDLQDHRNRRNKLRDVSSFGGDSTSVVRNGGFRINGTRGAHNSYGDRNNHGRNGARSHWNEGSYGEKRHGGWRANERNDDFRGSDRFGRGGRFGSKQRDDFDEFSGRNRMDRERDFGRDRPRRDKFDELSGRNRMDRGRDFGRDRPRRDKFDELSGRNRMDRGRDFGRDRPRRGNFDEISCRNGMNRERDFGRDKARRRIRTMSG